MQFNKTFNKSTILLGLIVLGGLNISQSFATSKDLSSKDSKKLFKVLSNIGAVPVSSVDSEEIKVITVREVFCRSITFYKNTPHRKPVKQKYCDLVDSYSEKKLTASGGAAELIFTSLKNTGIKEQFSRSKKKSTIGAHEINCEFDDSYTCTVTE